MTPKFTYKTLGPIETNIVARLTYEKKTLVTAEELDVLFNLTPRDRKQIVFRLKKKNILKTIKPGFYIFSPLEAGPAGSGIDEFLIPNLFFPQKNYYIGYSTMFNYYGFTEQLFQTVYVLNTTKRMEKIICNKAFKFLKIPDSRMYGLETIKVRDADVNISSKERTMIDLIYFNKPVGGLRVARQIFAQIVKDKKCDVKKLVDYAARFPNVTTRKQIGIVLESLKVPDSILKPLAKSVAKTAVSSLSDSRKGTLNKKWRVMIDDSQQ